MRVRVYNVIYTTWISIVSACFSLLHFVSLCFTLFHFALSHPYGPITRAGPMTIEWLPGGACRKAFACQLH